MLYRMSKFLVVSAVGADALRVGVDMFAGMNSGGNLIGGLYDQLTEFDKNLIYLSRRLR